MTIEDFEEFSVTREEFGRNMTVAIDEVQANSTRKTFIISIENSVAGGTSDSGMQHKISEKLQPTAEDRSVAELIGNFILEADINGGINIRYLKNETSASNAHKTLVSTMILTSETIKRNIKTLYCILLPGNHEYDKATSGTLRLALSVKDLILDSPSPAIAADFHENLNQHTASSEMYNTEVNDNIEEGLLFIYCQLFNGQGLDSFDAIKSKRGLTEQIKPTREILLREKLSRRRNRCPRR